MTLIKGPDAMGKDEMGVYLISSSSTNIVRVCRPTLQAETCASTSVVEKSIRIRAAIADARGCLLRTNVHLWNLHHTHVSLFGVTHQTSVRRSDSLQCDRIIGIFSDPTPSMSDPQKNVR